MMQQPSIISNQISRSFDEHCQAHTAATAASSRFLLHREVDAARALLSLTPALRDSAPQTTPLVTDGTMLPEVLYRQYRPVPQFSSSFLSSSSTMLPVASSHNIFFYNSFREIPPTVMTNTMQRIPIHTIAACNVPQTIRSSGGCMSNKFRFHTVATAATTTVAAMEDSSGNSSVMISYGDASSSDNSVASHSEVVISIKKKNKKKKKTSTKLTAASSEEYPHIHADTRFYDGSTSLALPEDEESLSPLHCFMRKYCVEVFTATAEDVATPRYGKTHGRHIVAGQVGLQCVHCKHRPYESRQERAVCFPSSLKNIYHSIETWQRRHSLVCEDIPAWAKATMTDLMNKSRSGAGGRRQYWEESARRLGMVDTPTGIRFIRSPGEVLALPADPQDENNNAVDDNAAAPRAPLISRNQKPSRPLVFENDRPLVTSYLYLLLEQMETCHFTEQDRVGGRSKVKDCPIGYPGLQCKHCTGKAGFGRYFPASEAALTSANSDRNIYNHVSKCRKCPAHVRETLHRFSKEENHYKNRRGSRKIFFQRVWGRMHGTSSSNLD
jgi:hypothetical protein